MIFLKTSHTFFLITKHKPKIYCFLQYFNLRSIPYELSTNKTIEAKPRIFKTL